MLFEVFCLLVTLNGGIFALGELNLFISYQHLGLYSFLLLLAKLSWLPLAYIKKIYEVEV